MTTTIATVNVNGIRAAFRKGMGQWLSACGADVVLTQEVRAPHDVAATLFGDEWDVRVLASQLKGRAGVGIACRRSSGITISEVVEDAIADEHESDSGRWLEAILDVPGRVEPVRVVSAYLHSGQVDSPKLTYKLSHFARVEKRLAELASDGIDTLVAGDFNVVRSERDIKNWKGNHNKTSGVLDEEIAFLDRWMTDQWVDVSRALAGEQQGPYTWWSWRGKAFDNDAGWRIDYHMASARLAASAGGLRVDRADSYDERFSDHAPLVVSYE
ncbi:endonuclease/exonuclease/phosphatase family protein [Nanchangia anserum]|uniref:Endonuclease/exonuclease/phosphatase family protein n=1 Tax=Nanchangia anserum TaxID=2692125 RepID=A0A8I0GFZ8_9ACTO|nr:exodeoxyribonuclease III [Nanchangia anserum]MBD3690132.1 endonuclease/exonuclease/phosphatase family protein [Nanchangia anserum]QOX82086.1 endonuclease/exonuclease/phosphatase family protein [Nanchangia anserum]